MLRIRPYIEMARFIWQTGQMKVPENVMTAISTTTFAMEVSGEPGDEVSVLVTMVANSATGQLDISYEPVGENCNPGNEMELRLNPGSLAQFCAAYLSVYHDIRTMR